MGKAELIQEEMEKNKRA